MEIDESEIDEAVIISMSAEYGYPRIYGQRLKDMYGSDRGAQLNNQVAALLQEIMKIDVDWKSTSLTEGGNFAEQIMAQRPPQLSGKALKLVRSYFTYQWR